MEVHRRRLHGERSPRPPGRAVNVCRTFAITDSNSPNKMPWLSELACSQLWRMVRSFALFSSSNHIVFRLPSKSKPAIRVLAGTKNSRPVGFYSRNSTKSTVNPNTTIHKYDHHGGAVCHSYGVGSMDPPDRTCRPSSEGVGRGGGRSE
jgi:hypothetical protein